MAKKKTTTKKPPGFDEFDKLFKGLMAVPKTDLTDQLASREPRKRRRNKR